ncbi:MAG TPA: hypothetical protein PKM25_08010 [Candidatus Ozemobacteraceae bacterium]|nr:hypothetical protein [Candidatus Ozemobacteraceae bacterium]
MSEHSVSTATLPELLMTVRVRTPTRLVIATEGIRALKCETDTGRRTIEPRRLDGVVALIPGILTLRDASGKFIELAIDEGLLLKAGSAVTVSVRHAIRAEGKEPLQQALHTELMRIRSMETDLRSALTDLETRFMKEFSRAHPHG